ncbi:MAG: hypothetical protein DLM50_07405 [Candidatus Meridianibacter frigidus]|nr:MAG: hypothetical protein DLM50_07405 [Candidatus Eremiobacteraeota bacterium]
MRVFIAFVLACVALGVLPVHAAEPEAKPSPSPSPTPTPAPYVQLTWRNVGPATAGGRLAAVAGTDQNANLYYIGSAGGGVWRSTNGGTDWEPVFDKQEIASIGAVAIDPRNQDIVWVGTGEANPRNDVSPGKGIYRSIDGGRTWADMGLHETTAIGSIWIDPRNSNKVVVGALGDPFASNPQRGVYRTTDGGAHWQQVLALGPSSGASDLASSHKSPDVIYAGMWQFGRTGWSVQSGGENDGLYRSTDGGATWTKLQGRGLPTDTLGRIGLAVAPSDPNRVYALIQSKQGILWRSDDDGNHWQMVSADTNINERPFYFSHVFVDPTNENHVFSDSVHLTESTDGGKTFKIGGRRTHGDHHAMWIASDGRRIIEGNDGGVAFSNDGGSTWEWRNTIPIGQLYRVGFDRSNPYRVCAPLQDNGNWCAPNNSRSGAGVTANAWEDIGGGDGAWIVPDPSDRAVMWTTSGGGNNGGELDIFNERTKQTAMRSAYLGDQNVVPPKEMNYRFNWETPIAFDPFNAHRAFTAGNVLFTSTDRGRHWQVISPDLTRNDRSHEAISGGVTLEGTGAETSETILYIEPSTAAHSQIWVGTDDGLIQLTRDGGKHWKNVTPAAALAQPFGRFASLSASPIHAGELIGAYDRQMTGDRAPYIYRTRDFGVHWQLLNAGLPADAFVRSVRQDPRNASMAYAGTEAGLYLSFDRGAHWARFNQNMPVASVRDVRVQPEFNDLLVGTHGRDAWILDDITPLQQAELARSAGRRLFPVRPAFLYQIHSAGNTGRGAGENPPYGAIITIYLAAPAAKNPTAEILDGRGRVVRRFTVHDENGKQVPDLSNQAGFNRFSWDLTEDKPVRWNDTPDWNQFDQGATVVPGSYTIVVHAGNATLRGPVLVKQEPRDNTSLSSHQAVYLLQRSLLADWSRIDLALNTLGVIQREAAQRATAVAKTAPKDPLLADLETTKARAAVLRSTITSNAKNDQDDDFLRDLLRERVQSLLFVLDSFEAPSEPLSREAAVLHALTDDRVRAVDAFVATEVRARNDALRTRNLPPLQQPTKSP